MKKFILFTFLFFTVISTFAQKINGQWRGYFNSKGDIVLSGGDNTEYVLELEVKGTEVSGFSYSYFQGRKYYVICKLKGIYYKASKSIKVTETEKVKGFTPPDFVDCFQVHYLTYEKEGGTEKLAGRWETAPGQRSGCGDGSTTLIRRTVSKDLSSYKKSTDPVAATTPKATSKKSTGLVTTKKAPPTTAKKTPDSKSSLAITTPPAAKTSPAIKKAPATAKAATVKPDIKTTPTQPAVAKVDQVTKEAPATATPEIKKPDIAEIKSDILFEKRNTEILKTIQIENPTFKVDLYDNGEVDGDSVSVFYNGRLILSHKRLSEKPITITLDATSDREVNVLTMYAENLGEIPPNTALMVITDGEKRYEARISSDLKNSGTIHFVHKAKTQ